MELPVELGGYRVEGRLPVAGVKLCQSQDGLALAHRAHRRRRVCTEALVDREVSGLFCVLTVYACGGECCFTRSASAVHRAVYAGSSCSQVA